MNIKTLEKEIELKEILERIQIQDILIKNLESIRLWNKIITDRMKESSNKDIRIFMKSISDRDSVLKWEDVSEDRNISKRLRFYILNRDNFTCNYCWRKAPNVKLHIDHKKPWSIWWKTHKDNLVSACSDCNLWKSNLYSN